MVFTNFDDVFGGGNIPAAAVHPPFDSYQSGFREKINFKFITRSISSADEENGFTAFDAVHFGQKLINNASRTAALKFEEVTYAFWTRKPTKK
uniref:Uncharacterized protein n=1 Tax=Romanomermis culicivorax TaxID=13658 RepID=A0A915HK59_ROMCU